MKKSQLEQLNASLDKALAPPKQRPKQNLDALLDEYDDRRSPSPPLKAESGIPVGIPSTIPEGIPISSPEPPLLSPAENARPSASIKKEAKPAAGAIEASAEQFTFLDATHTGAERSVFSVMYRETVSRGHSERHFGPAELMKKTGIRSRNTVHKALYGLVEKLSVEVVSEAQGNPLGPRYRVLKPQVIEGRRKSAGIKIDQQTKRIVERAGIPVTIPAGIPSAIPRNWDTTLPEIGIVGIPKIGRVLNKENTSEVESDSRTSSSVNSPARADDEAAALTDLNAILTEAARRLTGRAPKAEERGAWADLARVLVAELDEAAARSGSVSSVPAFLTEHLRRKLAHKSNTRHREGKQYASASATSATAPAPPDPNRRLTPEEIAEQARIIAEVIEGGYTMEQAEVQFAGSFHAEDWSSIFAMVLLQL